METFIRLRDAGPYVYDVRRDMIAYISSRPIVSANTCTVHLIDGTKLNVESTAMEVLELLDDNLEDK